MIILWKVGHNCKAKLQLKTMLILLMVQYLAKIKWLQFSGSLDSLKVLNLQSLVKYSCVITIQIIVHKIDVLVWINTPQFECCLENKKPYLSQCNSPIFLHQKGCKIFRAEKVSFYHQTISTRALLYNSIFLIASNFLW